MLWSFRQKSPGRGGRWANELFRPTPEAAVKPKAMHSLAGDAERGRGILTSCADSLGGHEVTDHTRRRFLASLGSGALAVATAPRGTEATAAGRPRRMTLDLVCGNIGVKVSQREAVELAIAHGFESVGAQADDLERMADAEISDLRALMTSKGLAWGAANLPVDFRKDDETFRRTSEGLPAFARALKRAGVTRVGTWLLPSSDTITYRQSFAAVSSRLRETARVLEGEGGPRLGLEYVGPKTAWAGKKYPFVHTLAETRELVGEIGRPGVGYVLDSWHWWLAGDTAADVKTLRGEEVVAVDLNDAPAGIPKDQQLDNARELPLATGQIPVAEFLAALVEIGYDGPVRAEPFNKALAARPKAEAVAATAAALKKAFALLG
jgi:sugar phosphate isomerase/epimerase